MRRRTLLAQMFLAGLIADLLRRQSAFAETVQYQYDALGRLTGATYSDGTTITYAYDPAGNRTQVVEAGSPPPPPPPPSPPPPPPPGGAFMATIPITGPGPADLRALANAAGYNGAQDATVTFTLASGVTVTGAAGAPNGGIAIDTGTWPHTSFAIALTLEVSGKVYGGGGRGGAAGGTGGLSGGAGGIGGDAVYCRAPFSITVNSGGEIKGGGGGGAGGYAWSKRFVIGGEIYDNTWPGGAGGGGFPNGPGGAGGGAEGGGANTAPGAAGTTAGGGAGSNGNDPGSGRASEDGGAGGAAAANGGAASGGAGSTTTGANPWTRGATGAVGVGGFAVRKNGHSVTVTNNGTVVGTQG